MHKFDSSLTHPLSEDDTADFNRSRLVCHSPEQFIEFFLRHLGSFECSYLLISSSVTTVSLSVES
jgi:hypothetical protein